MKTLLLYIGCFCFAFIFIKLFYNNRIVLVDGDSTVNISGWLVKTSCLFVALLPTLYILGNRYYVGTDYIHYLTMFHDYTRWGYLNSEPAIKLLFDICDWTGIEYKGFLWIAAIISLFISVFAICRYLDKESAAISSMLYLFLFFGPACNIIAQTMAISFIIFAYQEILNKRLILYLFYCAIAFSFHSASLIIVPLYWVYNLSGKKRNGFIAVIVALFVLIVATNPSLITYVLNSIGLSQYTGYTATNSIITFVALLLYRVPLYVFEGIYYTTVIEKNQKYSLYYLLLFFELIGLLLGIVFSWIGRISYFFAIAHVILDVQIINIQKKETIRRQYTWFVIFYYLIAFSMMHFVSGFDGITMYQITR